MGVWGFRARGLGVWGFGGFLVVGPRFRVPFRVCEGYLSAFGNMCFGLWVSGLRVWRI